MQQVNRLWLITNETSGSNDEQAVAEVMAALAAHGWNTAVHSCFPADPLPTPALLRDQTINLVAIFTGDGTLNAALSALAGWDGQVLVLEGGTMNLLFHRLFGDASLEEVLNAVADGRAMTRRPGIITSELGDAYAGMLAGPGTAWGAVREKMRDGGVLGVAIETGAALSETFVGAGVVCLDPLVGDTEGYPLLMLTPYDHALELTAYHAQTAGEYLEQAAALFNRNFREGPHEVLAQGSDFTIGVVDNEPFGVLLDGEAAGARRQIRFSLARCEVDLLAIKSDG